MNGEEEDTFLTESLDHEILMHRDAHFGGSFDVMLDYYREDRLGANPDFDLERIEYLDDVEKQIEKNLSPLVLDENEMARVMEARTAYKNFKAIYDIESEKNELPRLIADLILSEEEEPEEEINALAKMGAKALPELLHLIKSDAAYDPLFPGYGYAPYLACQVLARIKDPSAITPLFESLNRESIFGPEPVLEALCAIGKSAEEFLLKILKSRPVTHDNTKAAFALSAFPSSPQLVKEAFDQLHDPHIWKDQMLCSYLLCHIDTLEKEKCMELANQPNLPTALKKEIELITKIK